MRTLYILGNGFDLHHGLNTRYQHFGLFLHDNQKELYDNLIQHWPLPPLDRVNRSNDTDLLWNQFESMLPELDAEGVIDRYSDYAADTSSPDFRDRDWGAFSIETGRFVEKMTKGLAESLKHFIRNINYPESIESKRIQLLPDSLYLSFNYTNTLERYYKVPQHSIFYIHGKAECDVDLILGHGVDPTSFETEEPKPPLGLTAQQYANWFDEQSSDFDLSFDWAKKELSSYYSVSYKKVSEIIKASIKLTESLKSVSQVVVLGHSLNGIDLPYIEYIAGNVSPDSIWYCSYFEEEDQEEHCSTLSEIGIPPNKIKLLKINDLIVSKK